MDVKDLRVITSEVIKEFSDLVTIPGLALECRLANIEPNKLRNSKGLWDQEVVVCPPDIAQVALEFVCV